MREGSLYRKPSYSECVFCAARPTEKEDIIAVWLRAWLRKNCPLPAGATFEIGFSTGGTIHRVIKPKPASDTTMTLKAVCRTCNGGWMKGLEDDVIPHLGPLLAGKTGQIGPVAKGSIASWAYKTAVMMGLRIGRGPSTELVQELMVKQSPNLSSSVWIGHVNNTDSWLIHPEGFGGPSKEDASKRVNGLVVGFALCHLAMLVLVNPDPDWGYPSGADYGGFIPLWPIGLQSINWPPASAVTIRDIRESVAAILKTVVTRGIPGPETGHSPTG
jgi:hypothetical protein